ncbi:nucleotidyltransferase domain-containing protein [Candidatus Borrarchaeum sp.]|uniref:type VII toxin-antitoxin system MntA family adenylyltransferase antitoxin n=1 Tax=Candidatus Borrarchaeum sp. TaxID=2846742 RepID=UPI002580D861|nr:nucleotidyltransferase domain-containing protein [Candidatus Borrarchaeum sp.]
MNALLRTFFEKERYVELAYLYGSTVEKKEGKLSDIDIGVYLNDKLDKGERFNLRLKLLSEISLLLKSDKIDLVIMNDTQIVLNFEIIKANSPIFIRNREKKIELEHKIMSKYLDRRYYDLRATEIFLSKVRKKGLAF